LLSLLRHDQKKVEDSEDEDQGGKSAQPRQATARLNCRKIKILNVH
jgi:hypothetical protein